MDKIVKDNYKYQKGSRVVCPNPKCCNPIGILNKSLKVGDKLLANDISYYGHGYKKGERSECKKCGSIWGMNTSSGPLLFINNGWTRLPSKQKDRRISTPPKPAIIISKNK